MENTIQLKKKSLKRNFIYNFISQILTLIVPLITAPYLSRIFMEEGNGKIAFANTIITYFTMIANLGFAIYGQREISISKLDSKLMSNKFWEIFIMKFFLSLLSTCILLICVYCGMFRNYDKLILLFGIQVIAVAFDVNFFFQGIEDFKSIAIRTILIRVVSLVCVFTLVKSSEDIWIYALIYSGSVLIANLLMLPKLKKYICFPNIRKLRFKRHLLPSLILFLPTLVTTIYGSLDKLMIRYLCNNPDYENGCYNQALKLNQVMLIVIIVIDSVMVARNSSDYGRGRIDLVKKHILFASNYVIFLGVPLIAGVCVLSKNLSSWYLGSGYDEVPLLLNIMSVRFLMSGLACVLGNELFIAIHQEKYTVIAHIFTCIINLLLNFVFIPHFGAVGGAITTASAETIDFLVLFIIATGKKYISFKSVLIMFIKPLIATFVMVLPVYFINKVMGNSIISFVVSTLTGMFIYILVSFIIRNNFLISCYKSFVKSFFERNRDRSIEEGENDKTNI